jgi:hypothetical protein
MALNGHPGMGTLAVRRAEYQEAVLVMYSAFLIVLFMSLRIFSRALKHNLSLNRDGIFP